MNKINLIFKFYTKIESPGTFLNFLYFISIKFFILLHLLWIILSSPKLKLNSRIINSKILY